LRGFDRVFKLSLPRGTKVPNSKPTSIEIVTMAKEDSESTFTQLAGAVKPFVIGGLAGMTATTCIQPIDMVLPLISGQSLHPD
jgi:hypothetical protein